MPLKKDLHFEAERGSAKTCTQPSVRGKREESWGLLIQYRTKAGVKCGTIEEKKLVWSRQTYRM